MRCFIQNCRLRGVKPTALDLTARHQLSWPSPLHQAPVHKVKHFAFKSLQAIVVEFEIQCTRLFSETSTLEYIEHRVPNQRSTAAEGQPPRCCTESTEANPTIKFPEPMNPGAKIFSSDSEMPSFRYATLASDAHELSLQRASSPKC